MANGASLAKGVVTVTGSRILGLVISLVQVKLAVAYLGPTSYGLLLTATIFISSVSAWAQLGTGQIVVRWVSSRGADLEEMVGYALTLALAVSLPLFVGANVAGWWMYRSTPIVVLGVLILSLGLVATSWANALVPVAQVTGRFGHYAVADVGGRVVSITLVCIAIATHGSLPWFYAAQLMGPIGQLIAMLLLARSVGTFRPRWNAATVRRLVIETLPLTYIAAVGTLYYTIDGVLLSKLSTPEQVGAYGLGYRIVDSFTIVSASIASVLAARFASDAAKGAAYFAPTIKMALRGVLLVAFPLAFLVWPLAADLVAFVGSKDMVPYAAGPLGLISLGVAIGMVSAVISAALIADYKQNVLTWLNTAGLVLNVALNIVLIPRYDATGAAWALVSSELFGLSVILVLVYRSYGQFLPLGFLVRSVPALLVPLGVERLLADQWWFLRMLAVGGAYVVCVALFRVVTVEEVRALLRARSAESDEDGHSSDAAREETPGASGT